MNSLLLLSFIICATVVFVMIKQINMVTKNIDANPQLVEQNSSVYAEFSAYIQENLRLMRADIEHQRDEPKYILKGGVDGDDSLEFLADNIRKLVAFESIGAKTKTPKQIEGELFSILSSIDEFLKSSVENGEELAEDLREDFANKFNELKA